MRTATLAAEMKAKNMKKIIAVIIILVTTIGVTQQLYSAAPSSDKAQDPSNSYRVKSITRLADGTSPDLSFDGCLIAYDRKTNNSYEVFLMNADASNQRCITLANAPQEIVGKHKGKATFHPGGTFLLISSENEHGDHGLKTIPGIGDNHDFWTINLETGAYARLTTLSEDTSIQYPRFSADGSKLMWSQRYEKEKRALFKKGKEFGYWRIMIADFKVTPTEPKLDNLQSIEPGGKGYYEPHGFSQDGKRIIFSGAMDPKKSQAILDIYTYDLSSHVLTNLTKSDDIHDEMAILSPDEKKIALMSGTFIGWVPEFGYRTDLCLMDPDGSDLVRLTHFNDPTNPSFLGHNSQITKLSWRQDGRRIVFGVYLHKAEKYYIYALDFGGDKGNNP